MSTFTQQAAAATGYDHGKTLTAEAGADEAIEKAIASMTPDKPADTRYTWTRVTADYDIVKRYSRDETGALVSEAARPLSTGVAEKRQGSFDEFVAELNALGPRNVLIYGVYDDRYGESVRLVTANEVSGGVIARTNDYFEWPQGPAIMMIDYDGSEKSPDELMSIIRSVDDLAAAPMAWAVSSSSCLTTGTETRGYTGQRVYIGVATGTDIEALGDKLHKLTFADHGHIEAGARGQALVRGVADTAVWQANRIDYAGGKALAEGVTSTAPEPRVVQYGTPAALTAKLTPAETAAYESARVRKVHKAQPELRAAANQWKADRLEEYARTPGVTAAEKTAFRRSLDAVDNQVLPGDYVIYYADKGEMTPLTVRDILDNPGKWHGVACYDPVEPEYGGGNAAVAKIYSNQETPIIRSFAHGGAIYTLVSALPTITLSGDSTADARAIAEALDGVYVHRPTRSVKFLNPTSEDLLAEPDTDEARAVEIDGRVNIVKLEKARNGDEYMKPVNATRELVRKTMYELQRRAPRYDRLLTSPTIDARGRVIAGYGYTPGVGGMDVFLNAEWGGSLPQRATREEAVAAVKLITGALAEFPFAGPEDRAAAVAGILTAVARQGIPLCPGVAIEAPQYGSGKSYLSACMYAVPEGAIPDVETPPTNADEFDKRLHAAIRRGRRALVLDNAEGVMGTSTMASLLTSSSISMRPLGYTDYESHEARMFVVVNGNNLRLKPDMARRLMRCRLDVRSEDVTRKVFKNNPLADIVANNREYTAAAINWMTYAYGRTKPGNIASYEEWVGVVANAVNWAAEELPEYGLTNPLDAFKTNPDDDEVMEALRDLVGYQLAYANTEWWPLPRVWTSRELHKLANNFNLLPDGIDRNAPQPTELREIIMAMAGLRFDRDFNKAVVESALNKVRGRVVDGFRIGKSKGAKGRRGWAILAVNEDEK